LPEDTVPHAKEPSSEEDEKCLESKWDRLVGNLDPRTNSCHDRKDYDPKNLCKDVRASEMQVP
jgi:hypothetical protein